MQKRMMIIVGAVVVAIAAVGVGIGEFERKPEKASDKSEVADVSAKELLTAFVADEAKANATYVGTTEQAVRVTGSIRSIDPGEGATMNVVLETDDAMSGVVCEFAKVDLPSAWKPGDQVSLKGICTGYLTDVILNRCTPVAQ